MRVIGGEFRSRHLKSLPGAATRPTPDRLRETLFDILGRRLEGQMFVDAYAGTGAVGIEALSRGAREAVFIEYGHAAADVLRQNLKVLAIEERAQVIRGKVQVALGRFEAAAVFADPPYDVPKEYETVLSLSRAPLVILQHSFHQPLPERHGGFTRYRSVRQGDNVLSFYGKEKTTP